MAFLLRYLCPEKETPTYEMCSEYPAGRLIIGFSHYENINRYELIKGYWPICQAKPGSVMGNNVLVSEGDQIIVIFLWLLRYAYRLLVVINVWDFMLAEVHSMRHHFLQQAITSRIHLWK